MYNFNPDRLLPYRKHYTPQALWEKIMKYTQRQGRKPLYYALLLYYILEDKDVPKSEKAIIIGALGYFILPLDLLPDITPLLGFTDDLAALIACTKAIFKNCSPAIKEKAALKANEWLNSKGITR